MKKSLFIIICILALLLSGCANRQNTPLGYGLELIEDMEIIVNSDGINDLYNLYSDKYESEILALREVDFSKPEVVYKVTFDDSEVIDAVNGKQISDEIAEIYESRSATSIASYLNSMATTEALIISSIFNVSSVFECKKVEENMIYFYVYDKTVVAVCFTDGGDDACHASASIVSNPELDTSDAKSFDESLESLIDCDFEVKKVY